MKTNISNIGALNKAGKNKTLSQSCAKRNLSKALSFHKYISERLPLEYLNGLHNGLEYTKSRLLWDNIEVTHKEILN